ncbi:MAG: GH32 C-terminal domain-containing protein [Candidatus Limisoma sp.]
MKRLIRTILLTFAAVAAFGASADNGCELRYLGQGHSILTPKSGERYVMLPVQESCDESRIVIYNDNKIKETIFVRLANDKVDYCVPYAVAAGDAFYIHTPTNGESESLHKTGETAVWAKQVRMADSYGFDDEPYRPAYHFTPAYGWMNDPNGMFYKDGVYHLYYQYNPYAAVWGNMNWGHATSRDLVHWQHEPVAISPDALGMIFSGSAVVDADNTSGLGAGTVVAFYTSAGERQMQSMAYSTDGGKTFTKYAANPVVTSHVTDFRDPKVIWHAPTSRWVMVLAAGQQMQFYSSADLKTWTYESAFGSEVGCHGGVWECPDLFELPVEGTDETRWVLLCNINPGGPAGGSATQYFVGSFDGHRFSVDSPCATKWMDAGRDHYATVTWSNSPDGRRIALAWMSNWQYAGVVPTRTFRSACSVPRDLSLYAHDGDIFLRSAPSQEVEACRKLVMTRSKISLGANPRGIALPAGLDGVFALEMEIANPASGEVVVTLANSKGEKVDMTYDGKTFAFDRSKSGLTDFNAEFASTTKCDVMSGASSLKLTLYVDRSSIEAFGDGGRFVQTNLVFPTVPYDKIEVRANAKKAKINNFKVYKITL